jgi:hypothetical protein
MKLVSFVVGSLLAGLGLAQDAPTPTDAELLAAFQKLDGPTQKEAVDWFASECERLPTYQRELIDFILRELGQDPLAWPDAPAPECYDSAHHTPGQVIPRRFVDTSKGPHAKVVERMLRKVPKRELEAAYVYDWGLGTVVEVGELRDPLRVARNAVRGIEPRVDLIESIVLMQLDGGKYREVAKAFSHAYADREGNAYRELTLYDAWASGADMEMPDVECLGIVHDLEGDWKRWVAPVPPSEHETLYAWIGERFVPYHRARGLRTALARSYLLAEPVQRDGYGPAEGRNHAFWERIASDPKALAKTLPDGEAWSKWLEKEGAKVDNDRKLWQKAEARRAALRESQAYVRRTFVGIMRELGAL